MFVQLRQDLERVRNLCYMVSRREKLSRTFFRLKEQTFQKQVCATRHTKQNECCLNFNLDFTSLKSIKECCVMFAALYE